MIYLTPREKAMQEAKRDGENAFSGTGPLDPRIPEKYKDHPHLSAAYKAGYDMALNDYNDNYHYSNYQ